MVRWHVAQHAGHRGDRARPVVHRLQDAVGRIGLPADRVGDGGAAAAHSLHRAGNAVHAAHRLVDDGLDVGDLRLDVVGRLGGLAGEILHLVGDDGESAPGLSRPCRFDGGVQRQQVGLAGDGVDQADHLADPLRGHRQVVDVAGGRIGAADGIGGHPGGLAAVVADLADHGAQPVGRRRRVAYSPCGGLGMVAQGRRSPGWRGRHRRTSSRRWIATVRRWCRASGTMASVWRVKRFGRFGQRRELAQLGVPPHRLFRRAAVEIGGLALHQHHRADHPADHVVDRMMERQVASTLADGGDSLRRLIERPDDRGARSPRPGRSNPGPPAPVTVPISA